MMDTWMWKVFHMTEQIAVLQRLNKLCRAIGLGDSRNDPVVTKPTLTPSEFDERIARLILRVEEETKECLKTAQLLQ